VGREPWGQITDDELPHLAELGRRLRALRETVGLSQEQLGWECDLARPTITLLEQGRRRTRRSTIERIADALVRSGLNLPAGVVVQVLVDAAGPALAPESIYAKRTARRRARRKRKAERAVAALLAERSENPLPAPAVVYEEGRRRADRQTAHESAKPALGRGR
jgi:transcriptional regulator with XRE-family HTH domain